MARRLPGVRGGKWVKFSRWGDNLGCRCGFTVRLDIYRLRQYQARDQAGKFPVVLHALIVEVEGVLLIELPPMFHFSTYIAPVVGRRFLPPEVEPLERFVL